jgi:hypothetical protein
MLVLRNVKGMKLTIVKDVHKHAVAVPKNVEEWLAKYTISILIFYELRLAYRAINMDRSTKFILLNPYNLDLTHRV